jgi:pyrroloquinoline quinone (PQQ) biosynthesis protein C
VDAHGFREVLLSIMEGKEHWAWPSFTAGHVAPGLLHIHLEQEYAVYVRDFAVMVGRAYVQCPIAAARAELAENLFEEETGGLIAGRPHADLFLEYARGLGMDLQRFERVALLPAARAYRDLLDRCTLERGWEVAAAVTTLFLEGTKWERGEIDSRAPKRPEPPLEQHPLVLHYGLPLRCLALTKAHRKVEGSHRAAAWRMILDHVAPTSRASVVSALRSCLHAWLRYRDDVAEACGITRDGAAAAS